LYVSQEIILSHMGRDKNKRSHNQQQQTVFREEAKRNENHEDPTPSLGPSSSGPSPSRTIEEKKKKEEEEEEGIVPVTDSNSIVDSVPAPLIDIPLQTPAPAPPPPPAPTPALPPALPPPVALPLQHLGTSRERTIVSSVLEKSLVNLGVLSDIEIGDKLDRTPGGNFIIQKPCWYTTITRQIRGVNRQQTLELISDLIGGTENNICDGYNDPRIKKALIHSIHGMRNLQATYEEDSLFRATIAVLLQRIKLRYNLDEAQML